MPTEFIIENSTENALQTTRNALDDNKRWQGKEYDEPIRKLYFGSRYFDPFFGMWMSPDPAAQFANPYTYGGDPLNYVDPNGEWVQIAVGAIIGAVVGTVNGAIQCTAPGGGGSCTKSVTTGFVGGAAVGAAAAATGGVAAEAAGAAVGPGAYGALAGGFSGGAAGSALNGGSDWEILKGGLMGAGIAFAGYSLSYSMRGLDNASQQSDLAFDDKSKVPTSPEGSVVENDPLVKEMFEDFKKFHAEAEWIFDENGNPIEGESSAVYKRDTRFWSGKAYMNRTFGKHYQKGELLAQGKASVPDASDFDYSKSSGFSIHSHPNSPYFSNQDYDAYVRMDNYTYNFGRGNSHIMKPFFNQTQAQELI